MDFFQRTKPGPQDFADCPELTIKIPDSVIERFNSNGEPTDDSWDTLKSGLEYRSLSITFQRLAANDGTNELYQAFIPAAEGNEYLSLTVRQDRQSACFFAIGMRPESKRPEHAQTIAATYELRLPGVKARVSASREFFDLIDQLNTLKPTLQKRNLNASKEYLIWKKYLEATRKLAEEKAILLKVVHGRRNSRHNHRSRKQEITMEYDLDTAPSQDTLRERLEVMLQGIPLEEIFMNDDGGHLDIQGQREFTPKFWDDLMVNLHLGGYTLLPHKSRVSMLHLFRVSTPKSDIKQKKKGGKKQLPPEQMILERFKTEFGKRVRIENEGNGKFLLTVPTGLHVEAERISSFMERIQDDLPGTEVRQMNPEGNMRIRFRVDAEKRRKMLDEIWNKVRMQKVKFLSQEEKEQYDKEKSGQASSYRGGLELGRLTHLRGGKIRVVLDQDSELDENAQIREGYLLPVLYGDLAQIHRQEKAMKRLHFKNGGAPINPELKNFIFDPKFAREINLETDIRSDQYWQLKHDLNQAQLNKKQQEAVWKALHAEDLCLIQGPPGTGKTTVIAEIIWQMLQENPDCRILIASQAHLAVDNVLERLYRKSLIRPLRVAASVNAQRSIEPEGRKYFSHRINEWAKAAPQSKKEQEHEANVVQELIGIISEKAVTDPEWKTALQEWTTKLTAPTPDIKQFFANLYLEHVNIVAATCLECGQKDFLEAYGSGFDCVIIDEASKATPPEMLIPMVLGKKIVIIGDHKQLPPMIEDKDLAEALTELGHKELAEELDEVKISQFEKLFLSAPESIRVTLNTQYRMHEQIMNVINPFYADKDQGEKGLICGISETMDRPDLKDKASRWHGLHHPELLDPDTHVVWVDCASPEVHHNPSYSNPGEVNAVDKVIAALISSEGWQAYRDSRESEEQREIGLVSFYGKQVQALHAVEEKYRGQVPIRLRTVDKFQGMEREIMIVSTVRSNQQLREGQPNQTPRLNSSIGFAKDFRRINVAFSRARRLLIIVGNQSHFAENHDAYQNIVRIIARGNGRRISSQNLNL